MCPVDRGVVVHLVDLGVVVALVVLGIVVSDAPSFCVEVPLVCRVKADRSHDQRLLPSQRLPSVTA